MLGPLPIRCTVRDGGAATRVIVQEKEGGPKGDFGRPKGDFGRFHTTEGGHVDG